MRKFLLPALAILPLPGLACDGIGVPTGDMSESRLIIEYNATDGDMGVHGAFDDEGWTRLCVTDPLGLTILDVTPKAELGSLGLGSVFFESREPLEDDWTYNDLKSQFAEGTYHALVATVDGKVLEGMAQFSTVVPEMPRISGPEGLSEDEDEIEETVAPGPVTITWTPVTASLDGRPLTITGYELIVTDDGYDDPNGFSRPVLDVHLGPQATGFEVGDGFLQPDRLYEVEVLALESSGNQTIGVMWMQTGK